MNEQNTPFIFILSWNRPLYLWVCLDSIYRHTTVPCKIVIADNNSTDTIVTDVISGFERRGLFYKVHRYNDNDPLRFKKLIELYWNEISDYFVLIEGDIEILPTKEDCWLSKMVGYMDQDDNLASVGSVVYKQDFVSKEIAHRLEPNLNENEIAFLIKADAPMRNYVETEQILIEPHNAPLRLLLLRKSAYEKIEFGMDFFIYDQFKRLGYDAKISTEVVHRHLSLLNIFDYSVYNETERNCFFNVQKHR
jgi:GT2 family glycosyltransferase